MTRASGDTIPKEQMPTRLEHLLVRDEIRTRIEELIGSLLSREPLDIPVQG